MDNSQKTMEAIVALCKGRGFIYAGSEIYGGLANTLGLRPARRGAQKQRKARLVEKVRSGDPTTTSASTPPS